jgi:hypothetical protein
MEQGVAVKFCVKLKKMAAETFEILKNVYSEEFLSRTSVFEWRKSGVGNCFGSGATLWKRRLAEGRTF